MTEALLNSVYLLYAFNVVLTLVGLIIINILVKSPMNIHAYLLTSVIIPLIYIFLYRLGVPMILCFIIVVFVAIKGINKLERFTYRKDKLVKANQS